MLPSAWAVGFTSVDTAVRGWAATPHDRLRQLLRATLGDLDAARSIGERYLTACPEAAAEALRLADHLVTARPADATDLRQLLARRRDEDAAQRRFAFIDGWVLPQAEAQICALAVLL